MLKNEECSVREMRERFAWALLSIFGRVDGYMDMGAGEGYMTLTMRSAGVKPSMAIDKDESKRDESLTPNMFFIRDLTRRFEMRNTVDLVTCIGVVDAIPGPRIEILVDNLTRHSDHWVVLSTKDHKLVIDKLMETRGFVSHVKVDSVRVSMAMANIEEPTPSDVLVYKRK